VTRGPFRVVAALLVAWVLAATAAPALAQDAAPVAPPVPAPEQAAPGTRPADGAAPRPGMTQDAFEARLRARPFAIGSMVVLKYGAAIAGFVLLVLGTVRRRDERAGLVVPVRASAPPPAPFRPLVAVGLWVAMMALSQVALAVVIELRAPGVVDRVPSWAWQFGITAAVTVAIALVVRVALVRARRLEGRTPWPAAPAVVLGGKGWLVATAVTLPAALLWVLLLTAFGKPPEVQDLVAKAAGDDASSAFLLALGVLGVFVAPVTEELLFRGAIFGSLRAKLGPRSAALLSSVLFAAVHMSWTALVPLFVLAIVLCWVYERSGSLVAPIAVHMLNNATSLLPIFLLHA